VLIPSIDGINKTLKLHNFDDEIISFEKKSGTTDGLVIRLESKQGTKYILKFDNPIHIRFVEKFLNTYKGSQLLPEVHFSSDDKSYFLYSYIEGTTHFNRGVKVNWLLALVRELLNKYERYSINGDWGRLEYPRKSWLEFNEISIEEARNNIGALLPNEDFIFIKSKVDKLFGEQVVESERYLLHGDTGVHNFVYRDNALAGVIDPSPMAGPLIYDFIYAFCSSPDDLNIETLFAAYDQLLHKRVNKARLIEEVAVQLYCRIGLSKKHHPDDLVEYIKAWDYWKELCM
jgi:hypothetical protein